MSTKPKKEETPKRGPGRPPLRGVSRVEYLSLRIGTEERAALYEHARKAGLGVSPFVMEILTKAGVLAMPKRKGRSS